jgi:hypothetical protein
VIDGTLKCATCCARCAHGNGEFCGKSCRSGRRLRPFTSDRVAAASASWSRSLCLHRRMRVRAGPSTMNGGGDLNADRLPVAAESRRDWACRMRG